MLVRHKIGIPGTTGTVQYLFFLSYALLPGVPFDHFIAPRFCLNRGGEVLLVWVFTLRYSTYQFWGKLLLLFVRWNICYFMEYYGGSFALRFPNRFSTCPVRVMFYYRLPFFTQRHVSFMVMGVRLFLASFSFLWAFASFLWPLVIRFSHSILRLIIRC